MQTYYILMTAMFAMAIIVFIALFFFKAGYGYLSTANWGPKINNKAGWVIMESPAFIFLLLYVIDYLVSGRDTGNEKTVLLIMAAFFLVHYFQRAFIALHGALIDLSIAHGAGHFLLGEGIDQVQFLPAGDLWEIVSPQFIIGGLVFLTGMLINLDSDHVIRHLRKPGDTKHYIPKKGLYKYVTSANYFGELTEWVGYAILTWSPAGLLFAVWTFANLAPRSKSLTEKYEQEFGDEYRELKKKNLIPFIW